MVRRGRLARDGNATGCMGTARNAVWRV